MIKNSKWILHPNTDLCEVPIFKKELHLSQKIIHATMEISSIGTYVAFIDGKRVGNFIMAPGWTSFAKRLQYQSYDITEQISASSTITVSVGLGWMVGRIGWKKCRAVYGHNKPALIASIAVTYEDGTTEIINTDESWSAAGSNILKSEIYDGETCDSRIESYEYMPVRVMESFTKDTLIPQDGEDITEQEVLSPVSFIITPKGERVIDFGQNMTGYPSFSLKGNSGDHVELSFAEVLDSDGNFFTDNYRSAQEKLVFICNGTAQQYKPMHSFMGFRYLRVDSYPQKLESIDDVKNFKAIVVHSDMARTGYFACSDELVNKLFSNAIWGQKGNYLDVPTDCPQRDERLGWTGDTQVFTRTGSYNFNVHKFFKKWLRDLAADQYEDGSVPHVIPNINLDDVCPSAAWADAVTVCPWQIYLTYGDVELLREEFPSMKKWVDYIHSSGSEEFLWLDGKHYGDWLGLDAAEGSYKGSTDEHLIASAFFAYSTSLTIKAGEAIGEDVREYKDMYPKIVSAFRKKFMDGGLMKCETQTSYALALYFNLTPDAPETSAHLAEMVRQNGNKLKTGFVGTPYLLHVLSENGYADVAYSLLLQQEYPSWLYSVKKGATTIWEHWDGIKPDGSMWNSEMNSFNHYAYGAVCDWMYGVICGINTDENAPAFKHIIFSPLTDSRLTWAEASINSVNGIVKSSWETKDGVTTYHFGVPEGCTASIKLGDLHFEVASGEHTYII